MLLSRAQRPLAMASPVVRHEEARVQLPLSLPQRRRSGSGEDFLYCVKAAGSAGGSAAFGRACGRRPVQPCAAYTPSPSPVTEADPSSLGTLRRSTGRLGDQEAFYSGASRLEAWSPPNSDPAIGPIPELR
jgi:hypothetical protein